MVVEPTIRAIGEVIWKKRMAGYAITVVWINVAVVVSNESSNLSLSSSSLLYNEDTPPPIAPSAEPDTFVLETVSNASIPDDTVNAFDLVWQ